MKKPSLGQISDYELKQLKLFKTVVESGGFTSAAAELNISRPTVSNHIARLEARLGMPLCKRGRGGFLLTDEGAVVYEESKQLLAQLDQFRSTLNNLGESPAGQLRIALSDTYSNDERCRIPEVMRAYCKAAPKVTLSFEVEHMRDMERQVLNGDLDIAFIPYHRKLQGLNYIHLFTDNNYLYCAKDHPLYHLEDDLITNEMICDAKLVHAGLQPHEEIYHQLSEMNLAGSSYHYESRIALALTGEFICFLPEEVARPYVEKGELKAIARRHKHFTLGAAVIYKQMKKPNRAKTLFLETIYQYFGNSTEIPPY